MGYRLSNQLEVSILFDGNEFMLDAMNVLNFLHIGTSFVGRLPTFNLSLQDTLGTLTRYNLTDDATQVTISVKGVNNDTKTYKFRLFTHKKQPVSTGYVWEMDGYLDAPLYWAGTDCVGYTGTSDSVLSQIAQKCGLAYSGSPTADSQLWMQQNRRYCDFANYVCQRGYISDESLMVLGVDLDGTMYYKNANALPPSTFRLVGREAQEGTILVSDYSGMSVSGYTNMNTGYYSTRNAQSLVDEGEEIRDLTFQPDVRSPALNTDTRKLVARGLQKHGPIDVGNVHRNSDRALYQNVRYSNLFSQKTTFEVMSPVPIPLASRVSFSSRISPDTPDTAYSGEYVIAGRAIVIQGTWYKEKLLGMRHGVNSAEPQKA